MVRESAKADFVSVAATSVAGLLISYYRIIFSIFINRRARPVQEATYLDFAQINGNLQWGQQRQESRM